MDTNYTTIRLLMTTDTLSGIWTYTIDLIRGLRSLGVEVHLATMGEKLSQAQLRQVAAIPGLCIHQSDYQLEWMEKPWKEVEAAGDWLLELEEKLQPDIIHLNNYCHGDQPWQAPVLMVGHSCINSWWQAVKGEHPPAHYYEYFDRVKGGLQSADQVVAPSKAFLADLQRLYGPFQQSIVIPQARWGKTFFPTEKENRILSIGRLGDEAQNIQACEHAAGNITWPFEVVSEGKRPANGLDAKCRNLKQLGALSPEEVADRLSGAAIYVLPAHYEPFGLHVLEAALSGCALVLGDIPSLRENWQGAALFAQPESPEDINKKIEFLIRNPRQRERMGGLALQKAREFSVSRQAALYLQQYEALLNTRKTAEKTRRQIKAKPAVKL